MAHAAHKASGVLSDKNDHSQTHSLSEFVCENGGCEGASSEAVRRSPAPLRRI
jgi:hypothetical protein